MGITIIFISHDFVVVKYIADTIFVMKDGKICEKVESEELFEKSKDDYTKYLIDSILM